MKRKYGVRANCAKCRQDIEWLGRASGWRDRGSGRSCLPFIAGGEVRHPKGKHTPVTARRWLGDA